ncbi:MAG TPA: PKD domain-containing protein [Thermoanaerobaculia bacterium]|nr:PKD domain-containing protein [Thermoanaerobaculia bacterium]
MTTALAAPVLAQKHPLPGSASSAPVICTNCGGNNPWGEANAGKPTWPYSPPIKNFVGRWIDSSSTVDDQGHGMRTARAGKVLVVPTTRGNAPPRAYMQMGAMLGAFNLSTLFTTKLPAGLVPINTMRSMNGVPYQRVSGDLEKIIIPDAYVYPEATGSGWTTQNVDGQERLYDFDVDDRGYVYAAYMIIGWGMVQDTSAAAGQLQKVFQVSGKESPTEANQNDKIMPFGPTGIIAAKVNNHYYAIVADSLTGKDSMIFNVDDPSSYSSSAPNAGAQLLQRVVRPYTNSKELGFFSWAKSADGTKLAYVDGNFDLRIIEMSAYINGGSPLVITHHAAGKVFSAVTADANGNFWAVDRNSNGVGANTLSKYAASTGFTRETFDVYGQNFAPGLIKSGEGYLAISGDTAGNASSSGIDTLFFDIKSGTPKLIDTAGFFKKYYNFPPSGYAKPENYTSTVRGLGFYKQNNKVYFILGMHGLGDVYEITAGDSISAAAAKSGTVNPKSKGDAGFTYYGDPVSFTAQSSNPSSFALNVAWNFGNPESADNVAASTTGSTVTHQYSGLTTAAQITATKTASVSVPADASLSDTVAVSMKVPTARILAGNAGTVLTNNTIQPTLVVGEAFNDGSDGSVEGHYTDWTIDNTTTSLLPSQPVPAGACGAHTLSMVAKYGPYTQVGSIFTPNYAQSYSTQITNVSYTVRPFNAAINNPSGNNTNVTFTGTATTPVAGTIAAATTKWTVTWTLKSSASANASVISTQTTNDNIGSIASFVVPRNSIVAGSVLTLTVELPPTALSGSCANLNSVTDSLTLSTPDPAIAKSGCEHANDPCSFTASSASNASMTGWTYAWTLKNGSTVVTTGVGNPWTPTIGTAGTYNVSLTATKSLFSGSAEIASFNVLAPICGALPAANVLQILAAGSAGCNGTSCQTGESIALTASAFGIVLEECNTYNWSFGDGTTSVGAGSAFSTVNHTFGSNSSYTVTLKITNGTNPTGVTVQKTITFGVVAPPPPPPPTCDAPGSVGINFTGSKGCSPTVACKTDELVTFLPQRVRAAQSCETYAWTFDGGSPSSAVTPQKTFTTVGAHTVTLRITGSSPSNTAGVTVNVVQGTGTGNCDPLPAANRAEIHYVGQASQCTQAAKQTCRIDENFTFDASIFGYTTQTCDKFEWNFGDGGTSTQKSPVHKFIGGLSAYHVTMRMYNDTNATGFTVSADMQLQGGQVIEPPVIALNGPTSGGKNVAMTFTATSDKSGTTAWKWTVTNPNNIVERVDTSQQGTTSATSSFTYSFTGTGAYDVAVEARNGNSVPTTVHRTVTITTTPQYKYLLPVVVHGAGTGSSTWRTDLQVFNSDPTVSSSNPLRLQFEFKGITKTLEITSSTFISEDFMRYLVSDRDENGPVIVTTSTNFLPQIWTRTYNVSAAGTFGQFIPAILLSGNGAASTDTAVAGDSIYHLAGLRNDTRYRTNIGFVNPNSAAFDVTVTVSDEQNFEIGRFTRHLNSFQLDQLPITAVVSNLPENKSFSIQIETPANQLVIAYASLIDGYTNDPTYIQAVRASELTSEDYRHIVLPGVGHFQQWRSDVTIFNDDQKGMQFDLAYYDQGGNKVSEAKNLRLSPFTSMQLNDVLKAGVLPSTPDSIGTLRVDVQTDHERFPVSFSRTYFDQGVLGSYGQGIPSFSAMRPNVRTGKPALIPAVRQTGDYYTNVGLVNVSAQASKVRVILLDPATGAAGPYRDYDLQPNQSLIQTEFISAVGSSVLNATLRVEIVSGGDVWAYASVIDRRTKDPEYIAAIPTN